MIVKDQGIVLRTLPLANTSQIVIWLTADGGKLATAAKGSQRPNSPFLGQYDLFYTCELLYYARAPRGLHILKECTPLAPRSALRRDWRACAVASYAASLFDRILPDGPADPALYRLLDDTLDDLAGRTPGPAFLPRFELRLLRTLGLAPDWSRCARCRSPLLLPRLPHPSRPSAHLDASAGRLLCPACAKDSGTASSLPLAFPTLGILASITAGRTIPPALPAAVYRELRQAVGLWLEHHADIAPRSRAAALEILEAPAPA